MVTVFDVLLVHGVGRHEVGAIPSTKDEEELLPESVGEAGYEVGGVFREDCELSLMACALGVALEAILVATLLLTHLAVPTETA